MNKVSLSIKITTAFALISVMTVVFLFLTFSTLFEQYMLKTEKEKVALIAETIEPMVAMNAYLGLSDEITSLSRQIENRKYVLGGLMIINDKKLWEKTYDKELDHFTIDYPVNDPVTSSIIGNIRIAYSMDSFNQAASEMRLKVIYYLAIMSILFLAFAIIMRYLLNPLSLIAQKVKAYQLGNTLDFTKIRMEPETEAISDAFSLMVDNVREYTVLLEQYKLSVDESSIVSKMNPDGSISYINDEFIRVCGFSREEILGSGWDLVSHPDMPKNLANEIWQTLQQKNIWKGILRNKTKSGDNYYVKSTIVPLLDENSELLEYISIQHDITQVIEQREKILRQTTDEITGLPNRVKLIEDIESLESVKFSLLSLDNYEIIKNYYGYEAVFTTLKQLATKLTELLKPQNILIYKLAGGDFGLLAIEDTDLDWMKQICRFTIEKIDEFQVDINGDLIDLRASVGLTSSKENYLSYAGLALRHSRETGKPLIYYEDQENLIAQYENNLSWTKKIKSALAEKRITLFVQPLVDSSNMQITKYECLVRLIDEEGNHISPFHFLDIAKKTKLYHLITHNVISISFDIFSQIPDKEFAINLSAEDILHSQTVEFLESKIQEYDIGHRVVLEIVESEGIDSFNEVTEFISRMKSHGCKIAIDDFGTGYSNFSYLMQLKVDHIKVDGSLIKDIDHNPNSQIICSTILNFASELEIATVAEFVHSESVLKHVKELGFDYLQGYHLGEPVPIETLLKH